MADWPDSDVGRTGCLTRNRGHRRRARKPVGDAVGATLRGHAPEAGDCELAMTRDIVIAADIARCGQPEIGLAVAPGAEGTRRLPRAVRNGHGDGLCLTGRMMDAAAAERAAQVSLAVPTAMPARRASSGWADRLRLLALPDAPKRVDPPRVRGIGVAGRVLEPRAFPAFLATRERKEGWLPSLRDALLEAPCCLRKSLRWAAG